MKKKILIVGNSIASIALAKVLSVNSEVYITSLADSVNGFAKCVDIRENKSEELLKFVVNNNIDMTIPTTRESIESDIVSLFTENKQSIFGPAFKSAEIAFNKILAKKTLYKLRIPTPKFGVFEKENAAIDYIKNQKIPYILKTNDDNSATIITSTIGAKSILSSCFSEKNAKIIIEDYVYGTPFTYYAITDGYKALPIGSSISYKHSLDGNGGQLTSGMGACSPNYRLSIDQEYFLMDNIIYPTLEYLESNKTPYMGIIGLNGIISDDGKISILGWQSFLQDCDAINIFNLIDEDLYKLFESCIIGSFSDEIDIINTKPSYAVSLALKCNKSLNTENMVKGLDNLSDETLVTIYPNIRKNRYLEYEAQKGPVFILTSFASTPGSAAKNVYQEVNDIYFDGINYRHDIGK